MDVWLLILILQLGQNKMEIISRSKKYSLAHPERRKLQRRKCDLKHKFGLTLEQYNEMFLAQNGLCLGCYRHVSVFKKGLAVDHDHKTGKVRGLLCAPCNRSIGYCADNPIILRRLADYLERSK